MNKKKKNTRIKHRKNQDRVKKLLQVSSLRDPLGNLGEDDFHLGEEYVKSISTRVKRIPS